MYGLLKRRFKDTPHFFSFSPGEFRSNHLFPVLANFRCTVPYQSVPQLVEAFFSNLGRLLSPPYFISYLKFFFAPPLFKSKKRFQRVGQSKLLSLDSRFNSPPSPWSNRGALVGGSSCLKPSVPFDCMLSVSLSPEQFCDYVNTPSLLPLPPRGSFILAPLLMTRTRRFF